MSAVDAVLALRRVGLVHGQYGIFHSLADETGEDPLFSVASLTEPGSFDLANLDEQKIAGLSIFLVLPGRGDPVVRFDAMVELARALAEDLDGILLDERGSSWSIQRERYVREEIIRYRHQTYHV
jgi:cell division protein ZipA